MSTLIFVSFSLLSFGFVPKKRGVYDHMGVSKNSGTPKSSILIGFSIINHPFWGTPIFGNTHLYLPGGISLHWGPSLPSCEWCLRWVRSRRSQGAQLGKQPGGIPRNACRTYEIPWVSQGHGVDDVCHESRVCWLNVFTCSWEFILEALHSTVLLGNCCALIWPHATRGISGYRVLLMRRAQMGKCDLQVLIPNYLASPSNCVQPAGILAAQDAPAQKWMPILRRCFIDVPSWSKLCFNWFVLFVSPVIHMYAHVCTINREIWITDIESQSSWFCSLQDEQWMAFDCFKTRESFDSNDWNVLDGWTLELIL